MDSLKTFIQAKFYRMEDCAYIFKNRLVCLIHILCKHIDTNKTKMEKEAMRMKESMEGNMGSFGGKKRGNDVIISSKD